MNNMFNDNTLSCNREPRKSQRAASSLDDRETILTNGLMFSDLL